MRELRPVVGVLFRIMDRIRPELAMGDSVTPELVGHYSSWVCTPCIEYAFEETLRRGTVSPCLEENINDLTGWPRIRSF